jgi:predicted nuclease of predicted toxin-antitoxin system
MRIYLDDNIANRTLAGALRNAGHVVSRPADFALSGAPDARHLDRAIRERLVTLTKDRDDFHDLHQLILTAGGRHGGIIVVRYENDAARDMKTGHIVKALGKLEGSGMPLENEWVILNQWR